VPSSRAATSFISSEFMSEPIEEHPRGEPTHDAPREIPGPVLPPARTIARSALKGVAVAITLLLGLGVWGMCFSFVRATTPPREWKKDAFVLEGEFRPDGSCIVLLDGTRISEEGARTEFDAMSIHGAAPEEFDVPQVECPLPVGESGQFFVWGPVAKGKPVPAGRYRVTPDAIPEGDTTAWEAALFQQRFSDQKAHLVGYDGYVRIVRADSTAVTGSFRIVARRHLNGPF
jgi:hypothetical protein